MLLLSLLVPLFGTLIIVDFYFGRFGLLVIIIIFLRFHYGNVTNYCYYYYSYYKCKCNGLFKLQEVVESSNLNTIRELPNSFKCTFSYSLGVFSFKADYYSFALRRIYLGNYLVGRNCAIQIKINKSALGKVSIPIFYVHVYSSKPFVSVVNKQIDYITGLL